MDAKTHEYYSYITKALESLITGLAPFVERVVTAALPQGLDWTSVIERKDKLNGIRNRVYSPRDLSLLLRVLTERLGDLGFPFDQELPRQGQNLASELREVRNRWAHNEEFNAQQTYRALDSAELLLRMISAESEADSVAKIKVLVLPPAVEKEQAPPDHEPNTPVGLPIEPSAAVVETKKTLPVAVMMRSVTMLSYAMAHCRIAVIDQITVENNGPESRGASVEIDVICAMGALADKKILLVDLAENGSTVLNRPELQLDPARMLLVEAQRPGTICVTVRDHSGVVLGESRTDVQVLASSQWVAQPLVLGLELLAAYVQPNAPVISEIALSASDLLKQRTGNSALDGYQSDDPARVDAIVEAIYDTFRSRDIRYAEPPASWGEVGQKVRTPQEVLEGRLGTCLDTTVTLAAALEQVGINSTLWLLQGHIFLGYWRVDDHLGVITNTDVVEVVNRVDLGHIGLVETTMMTGGGQSKPFSEARRSPALNSLTGDLSQFFGITDVRQAREGKIYPLPSRRLGADGTVEVSYYQPADRVVIPDYEAHAAKHSSDSRHPVPPRVSAWKNALLDLSLRNRLINFTDRSGFPLAIPTRAVERLEDVVNDGRAITLLPSDAVSNVQKARGIRYGRDLPEEERELLVAERHAAFVEVTEAAYTAKLRYLAYKAKTIVEETGANNLYLTFGMLKWRFNDRELSSPLVLVPVTLASANRGTSYRISLDEAGSSTPNYCLIEKLRVGFGLEIPGLTNPVEDSSGIDLGAAFTAVREAIARAGLPFRVEESVQLSILQFAKFRLWKDLDENWQALSENSLVRHLIETPLEGYVDPVAVVADVDLDELGLACPVPADSSQLEAVADAVGGQTFVLEGPPGTGKSQTITNLLARSLASGKRVLFVAEKRAALNVVKKRLDEIGLGAFSLDLHDKGARPAAVRSQIRAALDLRVSSDAVALKVNREASESSMRVLSRYADRLHEENAAGMSLYSARDHLLAAEQDVDTFDIPAGLVAQGAPETFAELREALRALPEFTDAARPSPEHPWGFIDRADVNPEEIHRSAQELDEALDRVVAHGLSFDLLGTAGTADDVVTWAGVVMAPRWPLPKVLALQSPDHEAQLAAAASDLEKVHSSVPDWTTVLDPHVLAEDIASILSVSRAADESRFFGRKKRRRAVLDRISNYLNPDSAPVILKEVTALLGSVDATRLAVGSLAGQITELGLPLLPPGWNPLVDVEYGQTKSDLQWVGWLLKAFHSGPEDPRGGFVASVRQHYSSTSPDEALNKALASLSQVWERFTSLGQPAPEVLTRWTGQAGFIRTWVMTRGSRNVASATPTTLNRWLDLLRVVEPLRTHGLTELREAILLGRVDADNAVLSFEKGLAQSSLAEREGASALDSFDLTAHTRTITRFTTGTRAVRNELPHSIPTKVLGLRSFNADTSSGQIGGLKRELGRQRGGMSVRALLDHFGELVTDILPCTLMSPESVARFFPARAGLFDIVVFDEASQIRVADSVGAMGRGNSIVVVGDSKQMPPTSFAESGGNVDDDAESSTDTVQDEESILSECVQARVPRKWLSWHYRSQDESLIAFSNHRYYLSKLSSFPAPIRASARESFDGYGISLVRVDGHFERGARGKALRTNPVEAGAIVREVEHRFATHPVDVPSLGIITFNAQQRDLIENLLRDAGDERIARALDEPDGLFVKNLENVQGDERDTILFSVAFSANSSGVIPLNFGPLTRTGGERRLNVAITRARRQVVLYASFDPRDLRSEDTSSEGIKDLKLYLEMAERGVSGALEDGHRQVTVDRHRDEIAAELRLAGFAVKTDVGLSDFRVDISIADPDDPEQPLVAVLLDGENWRARRTVADRDGLPIEVLEQLLQWPGVERVWLPGWLHHREKVLERLSVAVQAAKEKWASRKLQLSATLASQDGSTHVPLSANEDPGVESDDSLVMEGTIATFAAAVDVAPAPSQSGRSPEPRSHPLVSHFEPWVTRPLGSVEVLDRLPSRKAAALVETAIRSAVGTEGPIHLIRLAKLVAGAFGLDRVSGSRAQTVLRCVPADLNRRSGFLWPADVDPGSWRLVRRSEPGESRNLDHVPLEEIANAMAIVAEAAAGISEAEVKREALALFGGRRITAAIGTRLDQALADGVKTGRLELGSSGLVLASFEAN